MCSSLLTADLRERLLSNARSPGADHVPVVKLFNPAGAGTWLVAELGGDEDTLFGIADLGMGFPELGSFSLAELEALRLPFGLRIERDLHFFTDHRLSVWMEAARAARSIHEAEAILRATRSC